MVLSKARRLLLSSPPWCPQILLQSRVTLSYVLPLLRFPSLPHSIDEMNEEVRYIATEKRKRRRGLVDREMMIEEQRRLINSDPFKKEESLEKREANSEG